MDHVNLCIVGAGVVGIAAAEAFSRHEGANASIVLLEQNERFGQQTSSRNSEVIHAGLYYPPGSLKASLCREGNALLYAFCSRYGIAHRRLGKFILAQAGEEDSLLALEKNAMANAVNNLSWTSAASLHKQEPLLRAAAALFSPDTGIVDSHGLMDTLLQHARQRAVAYAAGTRVTRVTPLTHGFEVHTTNTGDGQAYRFQCERLVLAAGLQASALAAVVEGFPKALIPDIRLLKGNYFRLAGAAPFRHLIYPLPEAKRHGLGIHATLDLQGNVRFGPDVEEVLQLDYRVDPMRRERFAVAIRSYYPGLEVTRLLPDYAGIRPRLRTADDSAADFQILDSSHHGLPGLVALFGIESPGLTASLALAHRLVELSRLQR
ncbi:MAG: NAD(P)/FAD-dependent oxidoreductase [Pseudomonadales bacterium]|nr:NAD(P)/FAD-dependent oxidoreductase [Pseudomonadales bacterium]MCP5331516.1 NAD(P)/FAD-dependent oxidoreductase [Pseudomonadales bacterium]MCP5343399.1 NAD(P)/FAD-dependent oxidoreductase [Pseudomonadales bacterium]